VAWDASRRLLVGGRAEGFTFAQIAACLKASPLQCDVSTATLRVVMASPSAVRRAKVKKLAAKRAAIIASVRAASAAANAGVAPVVPKI